MINLPTSSNTYLLKLKHWHQSILVFLVLKVAINMFYMTASDFRKINAKSNNNCKFMGESSNITFGMNLNSEMRQVSTLRVRSDLFIRVCLGCKSFSLYWTGQKLSFQDFISEISPSAGRRSKTSLDNVKTSLCWGPRSSFWWTGSSLPRMEDFGTNWVNCDQEEPSQIGVSGKEATKRNEMRRFLKVPFEIHPALCCFTETFWTWCCHGFKIY